MRAATLRGQLAADLADEFGLPRPRTVSLRDVPGTTRALLPLLRKHNITGLSIGVNGGSPAPDMPNPGVWLDPASAASVLYMQTGQGQGYPANPGPDPVNCGGMCRASCVTHPATSHALCWAFRTDNSGGPMDADEVFAQFDIARWQFPGVRVYATTFDDYFDKLASIADQLPVTTAEAGDTWMTSTTADPWKMAFYREASRAYAACLAKGACDPHDPRVLGFTRLLAKLPEHTWGLPGLRDSADFTNAQFHAAIAAGEPAYLDALHSYTEQRDIAAVLGVRYLGDHPLAGDIAARVAALAPALPSTAGLTPIAASAWAAPLALAGGAVTLAFDGATGAITRVGLAGAPWADDAHPLARYVYRTFNDSDYAANPTCCYGEAGRQAAARPNRTTTSPTMTGLWADAPAAPTRLLVSMAMPAELTADYGAPAALWLAVALGADGASLELELQAFNKTATRLGEAHFFSFLPLPQPPAQPPRAWYMDKLGSWVDPLDTVRAGSVHQHGVSSGVAYMAPGSPSAAFFAIDTLDATVVSPGTAVNPPSMFPFPLEPLQGPVLGFDIQLLQNAFNTNTPQFSWDRDYKWRFVLRAAP